MNKTDFYMLNDPREKALGDAVYRAIAALERGTSDAARAAEAPLSDRRVAKAPSAA